MDENIITPFEIWENSISYTLHFSDEKELEWIRDQFFYYGSKIVAFHKNQKKTSGKQRRITMGGLSLAIKRKSIAASFLRAAAVYASGCTHEPGDLYSKEIIGCKCYSSFCSHLRNANSVETHGRKIYEIRWDDDNKS